MSLVGGRLRIASAPGQGARFTLTVPVSPAVAPAPPRAPARSLSMPPVPVSTPLPGARVRVLIADDHTMMRNGLAGLLDGEPDFEVAGQASDGLMAVELAREIKPDVILMDVSMPDAKVIGLLMFEESERAQTMFAAGAIAYLTKSGPTEEILTAIRACASVREPRSGEAPVAFPADWLPLLFEAARR